MPLSIKSFLEKSWDPADTLLRQYRDWIKRLYSVRVYLYICITVYLYTVIDICISVHRVREYLVFLGGGVIHQLIPSAYPVSTQIQ